MTNQENRQDLISDLLARVKKDKTQDIYQAGFLALAWIQ